MAKIRITPEQVRSSAAKFKSSSTETQGILTKLQTEMNTLRSEWEGLAQQAFYSQFEQWSQQTKGFVTLLNDIGVKLETIATNFEQADKA